MLYFFAVIDWRVVWSNGLWILGTAVLLGTFSYTYWLARTTTSSLTTIHQQRPFSQLLWGGYSLVLLGLLFTSSRWWETAVWLLLTAWGVVKLIISLQQRQDNA